MGAWPAYASAADAKVDQPAETPVMLVLGDSLGAAYGVMPAQSWVALLQARLQQQGYRYRVVNASISGETSAGGLARLPALLQRHRPQWVLIELGANDGLRGLPVARMRDNLSAIARAAQAAGARTLLFEMYIPTNYGQDYAKSFTQAFSEVAQGSGSALVPFWLATIAAHPEAFQDDGLHPNASAQPAMLDAVWPTLETALKAARKNP